MLYQILHIHREADGKIRVDLALNPGHPVFEGHFPGQPILPGACMVQMLKEVLQISLDCTLELYKASNIKFISAVMPDINHRLAFSIETKVSTEGLLSVTSTLYAGEVISMKFIGTYKIK